MEQYNDDDDDQDNDDICDRETHRIIFDLLQIIYHYVRVYKLRKIQEIVGSVASAFKVIVLYHVMNI